MPSIVNKAFESLLIVLDQLTAGIQKHATNSKLSANLQEIELQD
jgi:hypothetical protein